MGSVFSSNEQVNKKKQRDSNRIHFCGVEQKFEIVMKTVRDYYGGTFTIFPLVIESIKMGRFALECLVHGIQIRKYDDTDYGTVYAKSTGWDFLVHCHEVSSFSFNQ